MQASVFWLIFIFPNSGIIKCVFSNFGPRLARQEHADVIRLCKKKITEFEIIDSKNSSTAYVILYDLIDSCVLDSNRRVEVWLVT